MENWIYVGIFLDERSKKKLKKKFIIPTGWKEYFDHMTVIYNDGSQVAQDIKSICNSLEGNKVRLQIVSQGISDKAYAVHVKVPVGIPCGNKISHITLACSPEGYAVDSNSIENWIDVSGKPLCVSGTIKTYKANGLATIDARDI